MSTPSHTPGPWTIDAYAEGKHDYLVTHSSGGLRSHIARLYDSALCNEHGATEANARLIAAAPDLLAACRLAMATMEAELTKDDPQACTQMEWETEPLVALREAIAKAVPS